MKLLNHEVIVQEVLELSSTGRNIHKTDPGKFVNLISALSSQKYLLRHLFEQSLMAFAAAEPRQMITSQQFILGQNEFCAVRVNLWPTLDGTETHKEDELKIHSYEDAHDHNFDFLTIGHFGPGYDTDIYTYDRESVSGFSGEEVDMTFTSSERLDIGKTLWFFSGVHIHTQGVPQSPSASINIVFKDPLENSKPQFYFDLNQRKIRRLTDNTTSKQVNFLDMCEVIDTELSRDILNYYASNSDNGILKRHARGKLRGFSSESARPSV